MTSGKENNANNKNDIDAEARKGFKQKSKLEQTISVGAHGPPELKKEERNRFLGEFRERVIKALTFGQVHEEGTYEEILDAMNHPKARILKIDRNVDLDYAAEYIRIARDKSLSFNTVDSPDYKGDIGLIVAGEEAVNVDDIMVESRYDRLKEKGVPEEIIDSVGKKLCDSCFKILAEKAPEEMDKYEKIGFIDRLLGKKCAACSED